MTTEEKAFCESWVRAHAHKWQVLNRAQWNYQFRGKAMVRYVDEVQMRENEVRLLLEYLSSDDCVATLSVYDQALGAEWRPIKAWYEISNKSVGAVHGVRLYHGLNTEPQSHKDGPFLIEDGCAYKVSFEYHWGESEAPTVRPSESGVSYRIGNLVRDPDTNLFNYTVEIRERVQQDIAEYLVSQTVYDETKEEVHLGVKQSDVATTGKQAGVSNGEIVERKVSKNQDCTSDIHNTTRKELSVSGASVTTQQTLRGKTVTTESKGVAEPASADGLNPGESVTNTKTKAGMWDTVVRKRVWSAVGWLRKSCRKTIFDHSHTETVNVQNDPGFSHAEEAGNGRIVTVDVSRREDDNTYDVRTSTDEEKPVSNASISVHVGLTGTTQTVTHRNQSAPVSTENLGIGESVENTRTQGGLWNTTIRSLVRGALTWLGENCVKTIFEHRHGKSTVQSDDPGFSHVNEAGGGKVVHKSVSRTADGAYKVDEDETQEQPVQQSSRTARMTLSGLQVHEESRNQDAPLDESNLGIGDSVHYTKTPGGLYNVSKETAPKQGAGVISERCHQDNFTHHHTQVENKGANATDVAEHSFENGVIVDKAVSVQSNGTKDVTTSTTTPKPWIQRYDWWSGDTHHYVVKYGNQADEFANVVVPTDADSVAKNDHINEFNLHDGQISWSYGPWRSSVGDLKFNKHGKPQKFYMVFTKKHDRRQYHIVKTIQTVFIRGDAYTDFISRLAEADANSTQNGVLAVKLLEKYKDNDGNLLAEWVELHGSVGAATPCTGQCVHGDLDNDATKDAIDLIIKNFEASSMTQTSKDTTAEALRGLESAMIARGSGREYVNENTMNDISGGVYSFNKDEWHGSLGFAKAVAK